LLEKWRREDPHDTPPSSRQAVTNFRAYLTRAARDRQEPSVFDRSRLAAISGGKATVARMFVNMASGQRGLVCQYDVVCFDEVSGVSFDQKDGVNIMKGYMESGEFSRGRESIRAEGSIILLGNFEVDVQHQQRLGTCSGRCRP
jgi:Putative ATP-dependent Lon protease